MKVRSVRSVTELAKGVVAPAPDASIDGGKARVPVGGCQVELPAHAGESIVTISSPATRRFDRSGLECAGACLTGGQGAFVRRTRARLSLRFASVVAEDARRFARAQGLARYRIDAGDLVARGKQQHGEKRSQL
jgi:hypothetical protein